MSTSTTDRRSFNSRTPGGVRHTNDFVSVGKIMFQFTHPGRGATRRVDRAIRSRAFQFTHPGRGATRRSATTRARLSGFNSRTPGGVRRIVSLLWRGVRRVSIHVPREGCDRVHTRPSAPVLRFNSRTPGGVRPNRSPIARATCSVSIHAPREGCDCRRG